MRWRYTENYSEGSYTFHTVCPECRKVHDVTVPGAGLFQYNSGMPIQAAFPGLTADEREMLMTGMCDPCWQNL